MANPSLRYTLRVGGRLSNPGGGGEGGGAVARGGGSGVQKGDGRGDKVDCDKLSKDYLQPTSQRGSTYNCHGKPVPEIHFACWWDAEQPGEGDGGGGVAREGERDVQEGGGDKPLRTFSKMSQPSVCHPKATTL